MRKLFTKNSVSVAGFSFLFIVCIFFVGFFSQSCNKGLFCFESVSNGLTFYALSFPIVIIASIIYLKIKSRNKYDILGYLLITIGISLVAFLTYGVIVNYRDYANRRIIEERKKILDEYNAATIAPDIYKEYPDAHIIMSGSLNTTLVVLQGYNYNNQPDFGKEINTWEHLKQKESFVNYKYEIVVNYCFGNSYEPFVSFNLKDLKLEYLYEGISNEGLEKVKGDIQDYLQKNNEQYNVEVLDNSIRVLTNKTISEKEKDNVEKKWNDFLINYNINIELVRITVYYLDDNNNDIRYHVSDKNWN